MNIPASLSMSFKNFCSSLANLPTSISIEDQVINLPLAQSTFVLNISVLYRGQGCPEISPNSTLVTFPFQWYISGPPSTCLKIMFCMKHYCMILIYFFTIECGCCCEVFEESLFQPESSVLCHCSQPQASPEGETKDAGQTAGRVCHAIQKGKSAVHYMYICSVSR